MTDTYGPFDGSAPWAQDQWYRHAAKWAPSGVNGAPAASTSTGDLPLTLTGLNFTVGVGRAWVRGGGFERTGSPASQAVAANTNASLSRRDRVVLRRDLSTKTIAPVLIQGTPAASPVAPAVQQVETGQWDLPLFSFLVPPNSGTAITGVIDERGWIRGSSDSVCFLTTAARDAYFSAPGDGDTCIVGGFQQVYRSGSWHGTSPIIYTTTTVDTTPYSADHAVMTLAVPDPGFPFVIEAEGSALLVALGAGVTVFPTIQVGGSDVAPNGPNTTNGTGSTISGSLLSTMVPAVTGTLTGAQTVTLFVHKTAGAPGNGFQCSQDGYARLKATVFPA